MIPHAIKNGPFRSQPPEPEAPASGRVAASRWRFGLRPFSVGCGRMHPTAARDGSTRDAVCRETGHHPAFTPRTAASSVPRIHSSHKAYRTRSASCLPFPDAVVVPDNSTNSWSVALAVPCRIATINPSCTGFDPLGGRPGYWPSRGERPRTSFACRRPTTSRTRPTDGRRARHGKWSPPHGTQTSAAGRYAQRSVCFDAQ